MYYFLSTVVLCPLLMGIVVNLPGVESHLSQQQHLNNSSSFLANITCDPDHPGGDSDGNGGCRRDT